jgi:hypothetical protein
MFASLHDKLRRLREQAVLDLRTVRVSSSEAKLALDAACAEVMDQSESVQQDEGQVDAFYLTQVVRNADGEYFLLKTTDQRPYVKHLSQARAKVVLKAKYRQPGQPR